MEFIKIHWKGYSELKRLARQAIGRQFCPVELRRGSLNCDALSWSITFFCYAQGRDYIRVAHAGRMRAIRAYPTRLPY